MKIDVGCGAHKREGYLGVDIQSLEGVDYVCDVLEGLPFGDGEVDAVGTCHFLEHLPDVVVPQLLGEFYRVIKNGGRVEVVVPDLISVLETFLRRPEEERWGFPLMTIFGQQTNPGEFHKTGFSKERLATMLRDAGFHVEVCMNVWTHDQKSILVKGVKPGG